MRRPCVGEKHGSAKLKDREVELIRDLRNREQRPIGEIAMRFNVSPATISRVANSVRWKHLASAKSVVSFIGFNCFSCETFELISEPRARSWACLCTRCFFTKADDSWIAAVKHSGGGLFPVAADEVSYGNS